MDIFKTFGVTVWEVEGGASSNPVGQSGTPREFVGFVPNVDDKLIAVAAQTHLSALNGTSSHPTVQG